MVRSILSRGRSKAEKAAGGMPPLRLDAAGAAARDLGNLVGHAISYLGRMVNLLDTPGHEDFSEDTYLDPDGGVDSALMVIDCAKGVEERTVRADGSVSAAHHPHHDLYQQARPRRTRAGRAFCSG